MAAPKRTPLEVERDRAEIARLHIRGFTGVEIARRLEMSPQMVSYDMQAIKQQWRQSANRDTELDVGQELARLNEVETEAWATWVQSKLPKEATITAQIKGSEDGKASSRAEIRREQRDGNPAYLLVIMACIERRCKLLGLDAPEKVDIELEVRETAQRLGLDPDAAVEEARQILKEARRARPTR